MVLPSPTSLALTLLLASPFQWFTVAGAKTFRIPRCSDSGAAWGGTAVFVFNMTLFTYMAFDLLLLPGRH